ncbi:MAG: PKD domain-containing protein [Thermoplasmata archaeon]
MLILAVFGSLMSLAAPVSITVPFSFTSVSDADLDGDPATGVWDDALSVVIPLENAAAPPYGTATLRAKHDGSNLYVRIDGFIDVAWVSATDTHFWLGFVVSPTGTSHHGGGPWDGVFLGHPRYAQQPTATDTNGFSRPPSKDASQDCVGFMGTTGTEAPYAYTAEWRRPLSNGDSQDLSYQADGMTTYNFVVTTDSDGRGSSGGTISHLRMTNLNTLRIARAPSPPVAAFTFTPSNPAVGQTVTFDGSVSSDPDGTIVSFAWGFGDGATADGITVEHAYTVEDIYTTTLDVTDDDGQMASTSRQVLVSNTPDTTNPSVQIISPPDGATLSSTTVTVTGTASDDVFLERVEIGTDKTDWALASVTGSSWSGTLTLREGQTTIHARAIDISGNVGSTSILVTVVIPPSPADLLLSPLAVGALAAAGAVPVTVFLVLRYRRRKG